MGPVLAGLVKLQSVENRLRAAKAKLARCRRSVILQENQVRTQQNAFEAKKEEIQLTKLQLNRLELELRSREDQVARLRAALNSSKTNKEYAAVLTQLNTTRADNSKIEAQVLELMKDIEADEAQAREIQQQIDEQKKQLDVKRVDAEQAAVKLQADIDEIQAEWDQAAKGIPHEPLEIFKRVAETYDGEAVVEIEQQDGARGAFSCGGCFMGVTNEVVNLLMTRDEILRCPNCTRIVVYHPKQG